MISKKSKIFVAGHKGSCRIFNYKKIKIFGYKKIITISKKKLDLRNQSKVNFFLKNINPMQLLMLLQP